VHLDKKEEFIMEMIDVLRKLKELESKSPEIANALDNAQRMSGRPVEEGRYKPLKNTYYVTQTSINDDSGRSVDVFDLMYNDKIVKRHNLLASADRHLRRLRAAGKPVQMDEQGVTEGVQITVSGSDAVLSQILKLAGMLGTEATEAVEETDLENRPHANSPEETVLDFDAAVPAGSDLHMAKGTYPRVAGGDNPMATQRSMSIKSRLGM
jgi:hypothetical protein